MNNITVETFVNTPIQKTWELFTQPSHVEKWNFASQEWHTPWAKADLREGGSFVYRMEAKDGSFGFDFGGTYHAVEAPKILAYSLGDGRKVRVLFEEQGEGTLITESFEPEQANAEKIQKAGWQAILDNFKRYADGYGKN